MRDAGTGRVPSPGRGRRGYARARGMGAALAVLLGAACSAEAPPAALEAGKVRSIVVGRSSRAEVFAALGRPARTERSAAGEAWIYEAKGGGGPNPWGTAAAASGLIGAFVPYAGLVGSGLGLAGTAMGGAPPDRGTVSLTVAFAADGVVRDCILSSTADPAGLPAAGAPGQTPGDAGIVDCHRPGPTGAPASPPGPPGR